MSFLSVQRHVLKIIKKTNVANYLKAKVIGKAREVEMGPIRNSATVVLSNLPGSSWLERIRQP